MNKGVSGQMQALRGMLESDDIHTALSCFGEMADAQIKRAERLRQADPVALGAPAAQPVSRDPHSILYGFKVAR